MSNVGNEESTSATPVDQYLAFLRRLNRKPNRREVIALSKMPRASQCWQEIAEGLPDVGHSDGRNLFNKAEIEGIRLKHVHSGEFFFARCLKDVLFAWMDKSSRHTLDILYEALRDVDCHEQLKEVIPFSP